MSKINEATKVFMEDVDEIMGFVMESVGSRDVLKKMSVEEFKIMQYCYRLIASSTELIEAYGETLTDMTNELKEISNMLLSEAKES